MRHWYDSEAGRDWKSVTGAAGTRLIRQRPPDDDELRLSGVRNVISFWLSGLSGI